MLYLIAILTAALFFFGFLLLTVYEGERGSRFFAAPRYRLDTKVAHALFIIEHVDWSAFTAHLTRTTLTTLAHDIAHGSLIAVRGTERVLTRAVRALRIRRDDVAALPPPVKPVAAAAIETTAAEPVPVTIPAEPIVRATEPVAEPEVPTASADGVKDAKAAPGADMPAEPVEEPSTHAPAPQEPPEAAKQAPPPPPRTKSFDIRPPSRRK